VYLSYLYEYISEGFKIRHHGFIFLNTLLLLKKNDFQKKSACMRSNKEKTANISLKGKNPPPGCDFLNTLLLQDGGSQKNNFDASQTWIFYRS
jgi:hypothetical protein